MSWSSQRVPVEKLVLATTNGRSSRGRRPMFLKGPVSIDWLGEAARQPGKALHVGVLLWFQAGLKGSRVVSLRPSVRERFGLDRHATARALHALEKAGLVTVNRHRGRSPEVRLLEGVTPTDISDAEVEDA